MSSFASSTHATLHKSSVRCEDTADSPFFSTYLAGKKSPCVVSALTFHPADPSFMSGEFDLDFLSHHVPHLQVAKHASELPTTGKFVCTSIPCSMNTGWRPQFPP